MENMTKPEWFEIADNDKPTKRSVKPSRSVLAVVATLALTTLAGWGFITNDESLANASESGGVSQLSDLTPAAGSASSESTTPATSPTTPTKKPVVITPPSSSKSDTILPPTSKGGDDNGKEKSDGKKSTKSEKSDNNERESGHDD